jgi:hypothetical protein
MSKTAGTGLKDADGIYQSAARRLKLSARDREPVCDLIKYYEQAVDLLLAVVQKNR